MSELVALDGDGEQQFIWLQERGDTCGPAAVYMVERILGRACFGGGEERITFLTSLLPEGYHEGSGAQSFTALREVLNRIGIPSAAMVAGNLQNFVGEAFFPFIARVGWKNGGGHFVVVAKTTADGRLVCLDPWYGLAQPPIGALPSYTVGENYRLQISMLDPVDGKLSGHVIFPNASA